MSEKQKIEKCRKSERSAYPVEFTENCKLLQKEIGYIFTNERYLWVAMTHSSYSYEKKSQKVAVPSNERLEFLGDSVLSLIVSEYIFTTLKDFPEGELTKLRSFAVCEDALYSFAKSIDLGKYLLLGNGEERNNGRDRKSILADATEALFAAVFIDSGYVKETVKPLIMRACMGRIEEMLSTKENGLIVNYKGELQQIVQNSKGDILEYRLVREEGPDHDKTFFVNAMINSNTVGQGKGRSKQAAEQAAAREALKLFGEKV